MSVEAYDYEGSLDEDTEELTLIGSSNGDPVEGIAEQLVQEYMDKVYNHIPKMLHSFITTCYDCCVVVTQSSGV